MSVSTCMHCLCPCLWGGNDDQDLEEASSTVINASFVDPGSSESEHVRPTQSTQPDHPTQRIQFVRSEPEICPSIPSNIPFNDWRECPLVCLLDADQRENFRLAKHIAGKKFSGEGYLITDRPKIFQDSAHLSVLPCDYLPALVQQFRHTLPGSKLSRYIIVDIRDSQSRNRDMEQALKELVMNGRHYHISACIMVEKFAYLQPSVRCSIDYVFLKCGDWCAGYHLERVLMDHFGMLTIAQSTDLYRAHTGEYMVMSARASCNAHSGLECVKSMKLD